MKPRDCSLKISTKLINLWPDSSKKERERGGEMIQINKIINEKGEITMTPQKYKG